MLDGLELTRRVVELSPETAVLIFSGFADRQLAAASLEAGARGVSSKEAPLDELV